MTAPMTESSASSLSPRATKPVSRRRALYAGVAAAAAVGGAGVAWWRLQPHAVQVGAEQALWAQAFDTPDGARLAMGAFAGKPLLLNFWATWCPPCVDELPMLNTFNRENKANGWQVVGLGGSELGRSLGNLTGGLPFTVVFSGDGRVAHRKMGQVTPEDLKTWSVLR